MPRSKSMLARQRSLEELVDSQPGNTPAEDTNTAAPEAPEKPAIDAGDEAGQLSPTVEVTEGDLKRSIYEELAKPFGWVPKEEWKRDPALHRDAETFLRDTPKELQAHKERARRAAQAAEAAFEDDRRRLRDEAEAKVRAAAEAQDPEAAAAAAREVAAHSGPPPQTRAWMAANAWFDQDPDMRQIAITAIRKAEAIGLSIEDQLDAGSMAVKRRFPERFEDEAPVVPPREAPKEEVRLSSVKPPAVNAPIRASAADRPSKEKGFADMPQAIRQDYERHLERRFLGRGLSKEEAQTRYATAYWKDN